MIAISDAMRALHRESLSCWQELLGPSLYGELIRPLGQVQVWEGDGETANSSVERQVRERHGIKSEALSADDLRQMFPGISRDVTRGLLVPGNGHTVSPQRSVVTLGDLFRKEGGTLINESISTAAGAGIGGIVGGKKGALIGAAIGGGGSTIFESLKK